MTATMTYELYPIGWVRSALKRRADAPKQGYEGAPDARIEVESRFLPALDRLDVGQDLLILTWLHESRRDTLAVHPRRDLSKPLHGVFATRSPDRPNPIGLHRVRLLDRPPFTGYNGARPGRPTPGGPPPAHRASRFHVAIGSRRNAAWRTTARVA